MERTTALPVLFIFFNRPDCVARTLGAIRHVRPARLYLATDAPRPHVAEDLARCAATRGAVEQLLDWPCTVSWNVASTNLGPDRRLASAISWLFEHEERAAIFEEDCVPDPSFFPFCEELLERYAQDPRVGMITGCQFVPGGWTCPDGASYAFARLTQIWGWATWRRAWANYDDTLSAWPAARDGGQLRRIFPRRRDRTYWTKRFDACHRGELAVWDYRWACARWMRDQVGIAPNTNLVSYIGFRPDALHTRGRHPVADLPTRAIEFPLRHPSEVRPDEALDLRTANLLFYEGGWLEYQFAKLRRRWRDWFPR